MGSGCGVHVPHGDELSRQAASMSRVPGRPAVPPRGSAPVGVLLVLVFALSRRSCSEPKPRGVSSQGGFGALQAKAPVSPALRSVL